MLKVFDLDLSAYEDITAVDIPSSGVYMTLVPEDLPLKQPLIILMAQYMRDLTKR